MNKAKFREALTMRKRTDIHTARLIVDSLGGTTAVANICEVKPASVSGWMKSGMPEGRLLFLQKKFKRIPVIKHAVAN